MDTVIVGDISLEYEDEKRDATAETKETRTFTLKTEVDGVVVGETPLTYEDLIASGAGGTRDVRLTGDVEVGSPAVVGSYDFTLKDDYGAVTVPPMLIWLILILLIIVIAIIIAMTRRR